MITSINRHVRGTAAVVLALSSMGALASHESSPADAAATLGTTVYVANSGSNTVTPIAVATNTARSTHTDGICSPEYRHHPQRPDRVRR